MENTESLDEIYVKRSWTVDRPENWDEFEPDEYSIVSGRGTDSRGDLFDDSRHICTTHTASMRDATLIAAAPDMLNALQSVLMAFNQGYYVINDKGKSHEIILEKITTAIAKAMGE